MTLQEEIADLESRLKVLRLENFNIELSKLRPKLDSCVGKYYFNDAYDNGFIVLNVFDVKEPKYRNDLNILRCIEIVVCKDDDGAINSCDINLNVLKDIEFIESCVEITEQEFVTEYNKVIGNINAKLKVNA